MAEKSLHASSGINYRQSGVLPFRLSNDGVEILLITSRTGKRWVFPKGLVEEGCGDALSAANEAFEEAGIRGRLATHSLGAYQYDKWQGICHVKMYLMEVTEILDAWPESAFRRRRWVPLEEFSLIVDERISRDLFHNLSFKIDRMIHQNHG